MSEEIIISIKRKKRNRAPRGSDSPHGILSARRIDDFLPRRLKKGGIRFYDLGRILSGGIWQTLSERYLPEVSANPNEAGIIWNTITDAQITDIFTNIFNDILSVPRADWKTRFYKIKKGDSGYEKSITPSFDRTATENVTATLDQLPEWKTSGLVLTNSQINSNFNFGANDRVFVAQNILFSAMKATAVFDYSAPAVSFTPSVEMDVFIPPGVSFWLAGVKYQNGHHTGTSFSDVIHYGEDLQPAYFVFPREFIDDFFNINFFISTYRSNYQLWQVYKRFAFITAYRTKRDFSDTEPQNYSTTMETFPSGDFPFPSIYTDTDAPTNPGGMSGYIHNEGMDYYIGHISNPTYSRLGAIVLQNGNWFYLWNTGAIN